MERAQTAPLKQPTKHSPSVWPWIGGKRPTQHENGDLSKAKARKVLNDILERVGEDKISSDTVASFLKDWLKGKDNPATAERYGHPVELLWGRNSNPS
jgi:hypothetical protein